MNKLILENIAKKYAKGIPDLERELIAKLSESSSSERDETLDDSDTLFKAFGLDIARIPLGKAPEVADERIIKRAMLKAGGRPVARITNNRATPDFIGPKSEYWAQAIEAASDTLNLAIPAVGRIEMANSELAWGGTGWLIAPDIIVTNKHVATLFARRSTSDSEFVFRTGNFQRPISCDIDFLEEESRADSFEHPITSILWIAPDGEADVAFLRVTRAEGKGPLPLPIRLADQDEIDIQIAAIGYPGEDDSIPDQKLVREIFGDVYEKKRLAVGRLESIDGSVLKHDCSTLGGNSGSVLINLVTGKAVGLHRGGLLDDSTNLGVPSSHLRKLLADVQRPVKASVQNKASQAISTATPPMVETASNQGTITLRWNIPIEVTVRVGSIVAQTAGNVDGANLTSAITPIEQAMETAHRLFDSNPDVLELRSGYRFKNGWITDERVIVIKVRQKKSHSELTANGKSAFPREICGYGVDVRTAPLVDQLEDLGVDLTALERPSRPAGYSEPPGYKDPDSKMFLKRFKGHMKAVFHVSPHAGFPYLKKLLMASRRITATMYEWEPNHISDVLEKAMEHPDARLRMVTQMEGVAGSDATKSAIADFAGRIEEGKFKHVWASVRGPKRLIQSSYHIKVATCDGKRLWLSSGNWKDSNQPLLDEVPDNSGDDQWLRGHNREWHAIIEHAELAKLFQHYIEYDFKQAEKFPLPIDERIQIRKDDFFVPIDPVSLATERRYSRTYVPALVIDETDEELDIQPLLTPDRDANGDRLFLKEVNAMLKRATDRIYLQNQTFGMSGDDNEELLSFFTILRDKQRSGLDVKIVFRDAREFGRVKNRERQEELLERMKDFGFDTSPEHLRLQRRCHTKGIIIDSKEVLLGSQNLSNQGALFNRDASLLVRSPKVAKFFEQVFLFDWEVLGHNDAEEFVGGIRRARPGEETPKGFRRVSLSELLGDS
ncbi:MAG: trypsin-like peptidase domain-containing protein [Planctomycetaceae bacterium]|nr:trypsin-like peptidase domain-containing protein [Planctomycetaceae bacterium]